VFFGIQVQREISELPPR